MIYVAMLANIALERKEAAAIQSIRKYAAQ